ncbi:hypothetical protein HDU82_006579 [Entophlyctis luteolus]|nr:hypothetical protein HDU82_006579 [Entophlyctis luteolus]KAJ3393751.1 hypothetical protein HDU84_001158 [Entophlyctis sp. JEL0112]
MNDDHPQTSLSILQSVHDAHCHCVETPESLELVRTLNVGRLWLMGTRSSDWDAVAQWKAAYPDRVVAAFGSEFLGVFVEGYHPWFVHEIADTTAALSSLRARLEESPDALLGEIGLDGVAAHPGTSTKYDMEGQVTMFEAQMKLAAELGRPVSVHAVGCFGRLESYFQMLAESVPKDLSRKQKDKLRNLGAPIPSEADLASHPSLRNWPPAIMLHSYSGSAESIRNIMRLPKSVSSRFYFSFSHFVNSRTPFERMKEKICLVPDDRLLVESDLHNAQLVDDACLKALDLVARSKGWSLEDTALKIGGNSLRFLSKFHI